MTYEEISQKIGFRIKNLVQIDQILIIEQEDQKMGLHFFKGSAESLKLEQDYLKSFAEREIKGFLQPQTWDTGEEYLSLNERTHLYLTNWPDLAKISFSNPQHLKGVINLIGHFHQKTKELTKPLGAEKPLAKRLLATFAEMKKNFNTFFILAHQRLYPSQFDLLLRDYYPEMVKKFDYVLRIMEKLTFDHQSECLVLHLISRGNLRVDQQGNSYLLRYNKARFALPIFDFGKLLVKSGRMNQWDPEWYQTLRKSYQEYIAISSEDNLFLKAYLYFPWELYQLCFRYYFNKYTWSLNTMIEKLERLIKDDLFREEFLDNTFLNY